MEPPSAAAQPTGPIVAVDPPSAAAAPILGLAPLPAPSPPHEEVGAGQPPADGIPAGGGELPTGAGLPVLPVPDDLPSPPHRGRSENGISAADDGGGGLPASADLPAAPPAELPLAPEDPTAAGGGASGEAGAAELPHPPCEPPMCVEWAPARAEFQSPGEPDPASAEESEAFVRESLRKWRSVRKPEDAIWDPSNAPRFERASARYQEAYCNALQKGTPSAHTVAYKLALKDFPLPTAVQHFGAIPGIAPGYEMKCKAHAAALGVHRQIYKGISCKKEGGHFGPAESIVISGGYADDEDNGNSIWYTGDGGQDPSSRAQVFNQRLKPHKTLAGNVGIAMNCAGEIPIRVMRKKEAASNSMPDSYVYDGLYRVVQWKRTASDAGPAVIKVRSNAASCRCSSGRCHPC